MWSEAIMPETEQQDKTLSEIVVKEAVEKGMDSPLRESILEAVEESDGSTPGGSRTLPLAGALFATGAALGFLAGRQSSEIEESSIQDVQEPTIIESVVEGVSESDEEMSASAASESEPESESESDADSDSETETETEADEGSSRLARVLLAVGVLGAIAILRRRLSSGEQDEWEPIEEFEPATSADMDDETAVDTTETGPGVDETEADTDETEEE